MLLAYRRLEMDFIYCVFFPGWLPRLDVRKMWQYHHKEKKHRVSIEDDWILCPKWNIFTTRKIICSRQDIDNPSRNQKSEKYHNSCTSKRRGNFFLSRSWLEISSWWLLSGYSSHVLILSSHLLHKQGEITWCTVASLFYYGPRCLLLP